MKQVRETAAGKSISAWVVMKGENQVAQVQAHYSNSGVVSVDCWATPEWEIQQGKASGYGYDKLSAALDGMTIDGHRLYDNCRVDDTLKEIIRKYDLSEIDEKTFVETLRNIGARPANWSNGKYGNAYYEAGLDRLKLMGYKVIQAI